MQKSISENLGFDESKLKTWMDFYSKKNGIEVVINSNYPAAAGINLENIEKPIVTFNPVKIKEEYNFSEEKMFFVLFHELEHLKEEIELKSTKQGQRIYEKRNKKFEQLGVLVKSFHTLENIFRDVFVNNEVIHPKNAPVLRETRKELYEENLFKNKDYLNYPVYDQEGNIVEIKELPKHLQFVYTIIREEMIPGEKCNTDKKVRNIIRILKLNGDIKSSIEGKYIDRLTNFWEKIEPIYKQLLEEDIKNGKKTDQGEGEEGGEGKNPPPAKDGIPLDKGEKENGKGGEGKNPFEDDYNNMPDLPHIIKKSVGKKEFEKSIKKIAKQKEEENREKTKEELELKQRARNMGLSPKNKQNFEEIKRKLKRYDNYLDELKQIKDVETGNTILSEIENLFSKIRSRRLKPRYKSRGPVDIELGVRLDPNHIASGIAEMKSGNMNPEMFEQDIKTQKEKQFVGRFDLTIVADGSRSMKEDQKTIEQKKSVILMFEALKRLHDRLEDDSYNLKQTIEFNTDGIMFDGASVRDVKTQSSDFKDKDRLKAFDILNYNGGSYTNDYDAIENIMIELKNKPREYLDDIKSGKTKKIVIVMSDGGSSDKEKLKEKIKKLRNMGVLVYGIGITKEGEPVIDNFSSQNSELGFGQVCNEPEDLAIVLKNLLKSHLEML